MHIIGIDHGNAAMKTAHFSFPSGIVEYEYEPYTQKNLLEFNGKYYVCGTGRQPLLKDKTVSERYYLLTLAALAKEMEYRKISSHAEICIAVGLPLSNYGKDKQNFKDYLLRKNPVRFSYEGKEYEITILDVHVSPQAVAAIILHTDMLRSEPSVIIADIGGWTVDLIRMDRGTPDAQSCRSLELGMIRCMDEIIEQVRRSTGMSVTSAQIETVLAGGICSMSVKARNLIEKEGAKYAERLISSISECGFDPTAMPIIFLGGGAKLMKQHAAPSSALFRPIIIEDVSVNAKGFERLCTTVKRCEAHG